MKVIFLDIDGVLNCDSTEDRAPTGCIGIEDEKVKLLSRIVSDSGAVIVLTSTWKAEWNEDQALCSKDGLYINDKLAPFGLHIYTKTRDQIVDRGAGIRTWLTNHPGVDGWAVLDDDVFADYHRFGIMPHLVHTRYHENGLQPKHVEAAIKILNEGP